MGIEEYTTKMGKDFCPACNYECDSASDVKGEPNIPKPHDVSICLNCGEWLEFADDMALIKMTDATKKELTKEDIRMLQGAGRYIRNRGSILDADLKALNTFLACGGSVIEAKKAFLSVFGDEDKVNSERYKTLNKFIEDYEKKQFK